MLQATLEGPVPGRPRIDLASYDLAALGYVCDEWFLHGRARSFRSASPMRSSGAWDAVPSAAPDGAADFVTRLVVVRPADPARFDGTVVLEWLNVSAGRDIAAEWLYAHRQFVRSGTAWVGVSAQRAGIAGGGFMPGPHLTQADPGRYAALHHPGDAYAFDIFSQAAAAVRRPDGPLRGLTPMTVLGAGASQSAMYLVTYVNAIDPLAGLIDGYLLHGRALRGPWVEGTLLDPRRFALDLLRSRQYALPGHRIRADVGVPVLTVQSETDVVLLASAFARQPDTDRVRLWEVAGAAHFDSYGVRASFRDDGTLSARALLYAMRPVESALGYRTTSPVNTGPQLHYVLQAAFVALRRWAAGGNPPSSAPRLATKPYQRIRLARNADGIARGGLRTPWVDAPLATLSGLGQLGLGFATLLGTTQRWSEQTRTRRYPGGSEQYLAEFEDATRAAVRSGFLLAEDQAEILALGQVSWPATSR